MAKLNIASEVKNLSFDQLEKLEQVIRKNKLAKISKATLSQEAKGLVVKLNKLYNELYDICETDHQVVLTIPLSLSSKFELDMSDIFHDFNYQIDEGTVFQNTYTSGKVSKKNNIPSSIIAEIEKYVDDQIENSCNGVLDLFGEFATIKDEIIQVFREAEKKIAATYKNKTLKQELTLVATVSFRSKYKIKEYSTRQCIPFPPDWTHHNWTVRGAGKLTGDQRSVLEYNTTLNENFIDLARTQCKPIFRVQKIRDEINVILNSWATKYSVFGSIYGFLNEDHIKNSVAKAVAKAAKEKEKKKK